MKKMNLLILPMILLVSGSCDPVNDENSLRPRPDSPESITYSDAADVPVIHTVDESDYTVYYIDSDNGSDSNDGLSESDAFKSFSPVAGLSKPEGTKILLKKGCTYSGPLVLKELGGTYSKPFIVDAYGEGDRPVISGTGDYAVLIQDDNIRFRNICITNKAGKRGIWVLADRGGAMQNIQIHGCRFDTVNWQGDMDVETMELTSANVTAACSNDNYNKLFGGVIFQGPDDASTGPSWFENLFVTDNEFYKVSRTGIQIYSRWGDRTGRGNGRNAYIDDDHNWYPNRNVVFQGNELDYIGGDGIVLQMTDGGFIDHNRCYHANFLGRSGQANVAMWPYSAKNIVMQFNEAAYEIGKAHACSSGCLGHKARRRHAGQGIDFQDVQAAVLAQNEVAPGPAAQSQCPGGLERIFLQLPCDLVGDGCRADLLGSAVLVLADKIKEVALLGQNQNGRQGR